MSISTLNLLDYACSLSKVDSDELALRNAIGRAYYAAFLHSVQFDEFIPNYRDDSDCGMHQQKINQMKSVVVAPDLGITTDVARSFKKLALILTDIKVKRTVADYRLSEDVNYQTASLVCRQASQFIENCDSLLTDLRKKNKQTQPA